MKSMAIIKSEQTDLQMEHLEKNDLKQSGE